MSNFDIEQCKRDGGLAIHNGFGEVKIIIFEKDTHGYRAAQRIEDGRYYFVTDKNLSNILKKKKITIYVYEDPSGRIWISQLNKPGIVCELIDTIEKEYDILADVIAVAT